MREKLGIVAIVCVAAAAAAASATAGLPHTRAKLFHPDIRAIDRAMTSVVAGIHVGNGETLDAHAHCKAIDPAINAKGRGYRHIRCQITAPGPLHVHGSLLLSVRGSAAVYTGRFCALGLCRAVHGRL